jgi:hypothetical protein
MGEVQDRGCPSVPRYEALQLAEPVDDHDDLGW